MVLLIKKLASRSRIFCAPHATPTPDPRHTHNTLTSAFLASTSHTRVSRGQFGCHVRGHISLLIPVQVAYHPTRSQDSGGAEPALNRREPARTGVDPAVNRDIR
jgi:hypothetical protein